MNFDIPHIELPFFTNLLLLLVLARFLGEIFERIGQPSMIGEIIAGIILGPSLLNLVHRTEEIKVISELGIFLLVIIAGLEINLDDIIKSLKGRNIIISILAFFIPITSGFMVGYFYGENTISTVFIGLCVAITALPVSIRILMDLGKINSTIGQKIISVAILDDVLALTILGVILNIHKKTNNLPFSSISAISIAETALISLFKLIAFIFILGVSYSIIRKIAKRENYIESKLDQLLLILKAKESLFALFFVFVLIFATITETLGFHFIIGSFFAAMLISESLVGKKHLDTFHKTTNSIAMGFLAPIFFAGIGLEFNFGSIENYSLLAAILVVSYCSKIAGGYFGGRFAGLNHKTSITMGIGLNARGIMELVIANIAYKNNLINLQIFSILVIMGIVTTLSTPLMLKKAFKYAES